MSAPAVEESPGHQRVGWLELFYDLVFVVVIEQITHRLHGDPSVPTLFGTAGLVVLVWTLWFNVTALSNISHGIVRWARIPVLASMAGVGVVALGIGELGHGAPWLFLAGWAIARTAVWPVWAVGRRRRGMGPWRPFLFGPGLGILWLGTGFVPEPWRYREVHRPRARRLRTRRSTPPRQTLSIGGPEPARGVESGECARSLRLRRAESSTAGRGHPALGR